MADDPQSNRRTRIAECQPSGSIRYTREGKIKIGPISDEPGTVQVTIDQYGEMLSIVLDEAGARKAAAALLAPFV